MFKISTFQPWNFSRFQHFNLETFQDFNIYGSGCFCFKVEISTTIFSRLKCWNVEKASRLKCWKSGQVEILKSWNKECWNISKYNTKCIKMASTFQHFNIFNISRFQPWKKSLTIQQLGLKVPVHSKRIFQGWNLEKLRKLKCWNVETQGIHFVLKFNISTFEGSRFQDFDFDNISTFQPWNFFNISRFQPWSFQIKPTVVWGRRNPALCFLSPFPPATL